jgi:hypothetical protein
MSTQQREGIQGKIKYPPPFIAQTVLPPCAAQQILTNHHFAQFNGPFPPLMNNWSISTDQYNQHLLNKRFAIKYTTVIKIIMGITLIII